MNRIARRICVTVLPFALLVGGLAAQDSDSSAESDSASSAKPPAYGNTPRQLVPYGGSVAPYRQMYLSPPEFRGPGRDAPEPAGLTSVRIGLIAPIDGVGGDGPGLDMKRGVELALEEASASGGYKGLPFELVAKHDQALWGASSNTLVELAWKDRVWALIGSIDSNSTHVALRAALKAELPIVNVGSADPTMTETGIPWIVRVTPDDRQTGYRLCRLLFEERGLSKVAVVRASNRYGRFGIKEFRDGARRLKRPIPMEIQFRPGATDHSAQLERLAGVGAEAVVLWSDAGDAARIVRQMRERGMDQPVFGTDRLVTAEFLELAGEAAEGVEATFWLDPRRHADPPWKAFDRRFRERFGQTPGVYAAYGYEAAKLVVASIETHGLNRARIRDALMAIRTHRGVAGTIVLDATSNSISPLFMARVEEGRFVFR